jgi:hypothetical protein
VHITLLQHLDPPDVLAPRVDALLAAAGDCLRDMRPFTVQVGPSVPAHSAVECALYPADGLVRLRAGLRGALATVLGEHGCPAVTGIGLTPRWPTAPRTGIPMSFPASCCATSPTG